MTTGEVDLNAVAVAIGPPLGDQVLDGQAKLAPVPVPGIQRTVVWRVRTKPANTHGRSTSASGRTARHGCSPRTRGHGQISCPRPAPTSTPRPMRAPTSRRSWRSRAVRWSSSADHLARRPSLASGIGRGGERQGRAAGRPAGHRALAHADRGRLPRGAHARGRPAAPAQHVRRHAPRRDREQLIPRAGGTPPAPDRALTYRSRGA